MVFSLVCLVPVRLLLSSMAILCHVNGPIVGRWLLYVERFIPHDIAFILSTLKRVLWDQAPGSLRKGKGVAPVSPRSPPPPRPPPPPPPSFSPHTIQLPRHCLNPMLYYLNAWNRLRLGSM